jgi:hypothetical protein
MKSILDRSFSYTSSAQTDIRKTFARIRRELYAEQQTRTRSAVADVQTSSVPGCPPRRVAHASRH